MVFIKKLHQALVLCNTIIVAECEILVLHHRFCLSVHACVRRPSGMSFHAFFAAFPDIGRNFMDLLLQILFKHAHANLL